jgi:hypothetical protein
MKILDEVMSFIKNSRGIDAAHFLDRVEEIADASSTGLELYGGLGLLLKEIRLNADHDMDQKRLDELLSEIDHAFGRA